MSLSPATLPTMLRSACDQLRDDLVSHLGQDLLGLWVFGAVTFPDRPARLGDVDTYAVVTQSIGERHRLVVDAIHDASARTFDIEWDSWYIRVTDARRPQPPVHRFHDQVADGAWALHRAHWLRGQYVLLHGQPPSAFVQVPTWSEIREGLRSELSFIERILPEARQGTGHAGYVVLNGCRILYSLTTGDVVVSKQAAARWALHQVPKSWHRAVAAALRVYEGTAAPAETSILHDGVEQVVPAVRAQFA